MAKFERLPPQQRKEEIQAAALSLFNEKGFSATTMENIVSRVSLSKGGVYRLYPSTAAILGDLMLAGMYLRNRWYEERVTEEIRAGRPLTLEFLVNMIGDSLMLYPEISRVYAEFLWEKRRNPELEALYRQICRETVEDTVDLIRRCGAEDLLLADPQRLEELTELMNGAILSIHALQIQELFERNRENLSRAILQLLQR